MALVAVINETRRRRASFGCPRSNPDKQSCNSALTAGERIATKRHGRQLMQRLMTVARDRGIEDRREYCRTTARSLRLCERLGFRMVHNKEEPDVVAVRRHL